LGSVAKFDFCDEIEKLSPIKSMTYVATNSSKTKLCDRTEGSITLALISYLTEKYFGRKFAMNNNSLKFHAFSMMGAFILLITSTASQATGWACTHGHAGNIEFINNVSTLNRVHIGWGLDFTQNPGVGNWIHFAPPSIHPSASRYIALQFWTGSADAIVQSVDVFNLVDKVKSFPLNLSNGWYTKVLDMGAPIPFTALGISVQVGAGVESMSHRFVFTGACAYIE